MNFCRERKYDHKRWLDKPKSSAFRRDIPNHIITNLNLNSTISSECLKIHNSNDLKYSAFKGQCFNHSETKACKVRHSIPHNVQYQILENDPFASPKTSLLPKKKNKKYIYIYILKIAYSQERERPSKNSPSNA